MPCSHHDLDFEQTATLHSKHGVILACPLEVKDGDSGVRVRLARLSERLRGQKYGFLDIEAEGDPVVRDVLGWLEAEMSV